MRLDWQRCGLTDYSILDEKLPILHHVMTIRSLIEEVAEREPKIGDMELLSEAYGEYYFKCPVFTCAHFQQGFPSRAKREAHVKVHKLEYKCPHENCAFHITGFRSESGLESHLSWFHEATQLPYMFPHLQPKSAWQSFEEAIDHDDVGVVRNFCLDSLDLPNPPELLLRAVKKGSFKSARVLAEYPELSKGLYEGRRMRDKSPLCLAAAKGESELTGYFLSLVTDGQIPSEFWRSTFLEIIRGHHSNVLRTILDSGKDLNGIWEGWRNPTFRESFESVANAKDEETTELLFRCLLKSKVSGKKIEKIATAVAQKGDRALVKRLFEFQENDGFPDDAKFTKGIEKIRSAGIDAMVERIMERVVDSKGKTWGNALQRAALDGNDEKIRMLVDSGADINHAESDIGTALQAAARNGHESTVQLLLDRGANPSIFTRSHFGNPLAEAAANGNCKIISILLEAGLLPWESHEQELWYPVSASNTTPLHFAAKYAQVDAITLLLENGASASSLDSKGNSTLHYLAKATHFWYGKQKKLLKRCEAAQASIDILVAHGADVTAGNSLGNPPLHELWETAKRKIWRPQEAHVDYLLKISALFIRNGADLNAKNKDGHEIRDIAESALSQDVREAVGKISLLGASEQI